MEQLGNMKFIDFEEALDRDLGKIGTPERDKFESKVDEAVHAYKLGEAIKRARLEQNLTQEELGERIGPLASFPQDSLWKRIFIIHHQNPSLS